MPQGSSRATQSPAGTPSGRLAALLPERAQGLGEIDDLDIKAAVTASKVGEPLGNGQAGATRTGGADDDSETGHGPAPPGNLFVFTTISGNIRRQLVIPDHRRATQARQRSGPPPLYVSMSLNAARTSIGAPRSAPPRSNIALCRLPTMRSRSCSSTNSPRSVSP